MSIKARLTISFVALFGVIVIAIAIGAYLLAVKDAFAQLDGELEVAAGATTMAAGHELNEHRTQADGEEDLRAVLDDVGSADLSKTQILVREQNRIAVYKSGATSADLRNIPPDQLKSRAIVAGLRIASRTLAVPKFHTKFEIYAAAPVAPALERIRDFRSALLVWVPAGLLLAGFLGYLLAIKAMSPLKQLAETIESLTSGELGARVPVGGGHDEVARLGSRFNFLLDQIAKAFALQRRFMADASHQIKTPVAVALTASQVVNGQPSASLADCRESLQVIEKQMQQLRRVVQDMFFLSQADTAALKCDKREMYLEDAVSDAVRAARALSGTKRQTVKVRELPEAKCIGDIELVTQAVLVLLDNAVKFTPDFGLIEVAVDYKENFWVCSVTDNGKGISETAQVRLFERFFREEPRSAEAPGAGLGLPIAASIMAQHGGSVKLVESRPGRTIFALSIPAALSRPVQPALQENSFAVRI